MLRLRVLTSAMLAGLENAFRSTTSAHGFLYSRLTNPVYMSMLAEKKEAVQLLPTAAED